MLVEEDFNKMVVEQWGRLSAKVPSHLNPMQSLIYKLNKLRPLVICWGKEMKKKVGSSLCEVENAILLIGSKPLVT